MEPSRTNRALTNIAAPIPADKFLVYYFKLPENMRCDPDGNLLNGSNEAGRLFESLEGAKAYASDKARSPGLVGAGVYDHHWRILAQFASIDDLKRRARERQPWRLFLWSTSLLLIGAILLWLEIRSGWRLIVGFLIGSRLLFSGSFKFVQAVQSVLKAKQSTTPSEIDNPTSTDESPRM